MWCFRHLLGGKGSGGPAPAPEEGRGSFSPRWATRAGAGFKGKEELLLKFRPKRQYQPQVTHLSFVYCLYYVNTFFGKYFCFYFIIKFRNLTQRAVASLARGVFSVSALSGAERAAWWPGLRALGRGRRRTPGAMSGSPPPSNPPSRGSPPAAAGASGPRSPPLPGPSDGSPAPLRRFGVPRGATSGHVGGSSVPARGSGVRRGGSGEARGRERTGGVDTKGSGKVAHLLPPKARPGRLRAFPPRCPLAPAESRPRRPTSPHANRAWPDPAAVSGTAGLQTSCPWE